MPTPTPNLDHPTLPLVKDAFPDVKLMATEFRGQTTLVVPAALCSPTKGKSAEGVSPTTATRPFPSTAMASLASSKVMNS